MKGLILVGGLGTQLRPLTLSKPKPLIEFGNQPQLLHLIHLLRGAGVTEVVLAINYRPEIMADFLEKHADCGVKITLSQETEPLGTAGPLALAKEHLNDGEPFFVLNCDVACEFSLRSLLDFHKAHGKVGTIMVTRVDEPAKYGKSVVVPMLNKEIPIIADDYVQMDFGSGALKITPAHDVNDYAIGKRHDLPIVNIMNKDATLNEVAGPYAGLDRYACREKLWADMEAAGLTLKVEDHQQRVPRSERSGEVIEPMVSTQWFVKMDGMAAKGLDAVRSGLAEGRGQAGPRSSSQTRRSRGRPAAALPARSTPPTAASAPGFLNKERGGSRRQKELSIAAPRAVAVRHPQARRGALVRARRGGGAGAQLGLV